MDEVEFRVGTVTKIRQAYWECNRIVRSNTISVTRLDEIYESSNYRFRYDVTGHERSLTAESEAWQESR
ncbi:hypothetical protein HUU59_07410 [bacterium]|nr:hypothetical protein [bacterium]